MINVMAWIGRNWKPLLSTIVAILVVGFGYIRELDARFMDVADSVEVVDRAHTIKITENKRAVEIIGEDIKKIKCMIVAQAEGDNPLSCIDDR